MNSNTNKLWPYSIRLALGIIPVTLLLSVLILSATKYFMGWPGVEIQRWIIILVLVISIIPLILALLDFFAFHRASLDVRGVKIDFSNFNLESSEIKRKPFDIPDNIGVKGAIVSDTAPMDIVAALDETIQSELVVIDLGRGDNW
jgi:hypothetical protein